MPKKKKSSGSLAGIPMHYDPLHSRNLGEYMRQAKRRLMNLPMSKHKEHAADGHYADFDLTEEERHEWELARLEEGFEFDEGQIDPAPFQLVRRTSVYKVHSLFSLLDLNRAYVTDRGRLVGVVALRDVSGLSVWCWGRGGRFENLKFLKLLKFGILKI